MRMTKTEREGMNDYYKGRKPLAVYPMSNWGGVEVLDIIYGIDDYAVVRYNFGDVEEKVHKLKIRYDSGSPYVRLDGNRIRFDECMRV